METRIRLSAVSICVVMALAAMPGVVWADATATGDVTPDLSPLTWTDETDVRVGDTGYGSMTIADGSAVASRFAYLGYGSSAIGDARIEDAGSTWTNRNVFVVGLFGVGTLDIAAGGAASDAIGYIAYDPDATGGVTVNGLGSTWTHVPNLDFDGSLHIGYGGNGTLEITGQGAVGAANSYIGYESNATGVVTVDGAGSTWTTTPTDASNGLLYVGYGGNGTLEITGGGAVGAANSYIGNESDATGVVTVDGAGSTWTSDEVFVCGRHGSGTLNITNGGGVSNTEGGIGIEAGAMGEVTVDGPGSTWTNSSGLVVGGHAGAVGTLNITNGGLVCVDWPLTIDYDIASGADGAIADSCINMATGGMLALYGDADDSLTQFLGLIEGSDTINYWDTDLGDWDAITNATLGQDYWLTLGADSLAGYTVLTVGAGATPPTPSTIPAPNSLLLASAGLGVLNRIRRRKKGA